MPRDTTAVPIRLFLLLLGTAWLISCQSAVDSKASLSPKAGITDTEVLVGSSLALGGHAGYLGTQVHHGALAFINKVNDLGGIHGRRIRLVAYDDGYDPPRCIFNTQRLLIEDEVFCLFNYVGTPTTLKIVPLVEEARVPLVGMFTGASALREPLQPWLINVRASYYQEIGAAVRYFVEELGTEEIAVFYQYDAYGFDGLRGAELALKAYGLVPTATGTYIRGTLEVEEGLEKIAASGAGAVVMIGTYEPCARFIRRSRAMGFSPIFYNVSFVGADELARRLGEAGEGVIVSQVVPPPELSGALPDLPGVEEYVLLLKQYFPLDRPNFVGLEGYANARVLVEGLHRAGRNLDRQRFVEAIESIRNFDIGIANRLSFSATDHQGLERVYFTRIEAGRFELIDPAAGGPAVKGGAEEYGHR